MNYLEHLYKRKEIAVRAEILANFFTHPVHPAHRVWTHLRKIYRKAARNIQLKIDSEHLHHI